MANKKKEINPIIAKRVQELISGSDKSIRWICENVLHYASSNFNRFLKGEAQPPNYILDDLAEYFGVRKDWIYGIDDYRTDNDIILHAHKIVEFFNNPSQNTSNTDIKDTDIPVIYDSNIKCFRRMSVKEEAKYNCIINALTMCGYKFSEINDTDDFFEFMDSPIESLKNSIELYMKTINPTKRKDGDNP